MCRLPDSGGIGPGAEGFAGLSPRHLAWCCQVASALPDQKNLT